MLDVATASPGAEIGEPTLASMWEAIAGRRPSDELLDWPPDVFALTNVALDRSEAFRFAISPVGAWPPARFGDWAAAVEEAGVAWGTWVEDRRAAFPALVNEEWAAVREGLDTRLEDFARGESRRVREALLTLHAIADEASAGLGVALDTADCAACAYRARGRELLARTGSLARMNPRVLRVLPKVRTPPTGRPAFSRYACVHGPGIEARWRKMPVRHPGTDVRSEYANLLLLPWPLEVKASDFRPLEDSVRRPAKEPFAFFEFAPSRGLDFDLLDRVLLSAREEAGSVDVVVLPECAVDESEIDELEAVLQRHGVVSLVTGVRRSSAQSDSGPGNWLHMSFNPRLEKGAAPSEQRTPWFRIRQNKHHRWSLDESQIYQYHLGGVLHPSVRWWEAMEVPRRAIEFVEVAELTLVSLVCEDLAQHDDIAELVRSVGPTVVFAVLLDGPQLMSRWTARYASVLADDPGSAVLTLTSFGMVQRSRPPQREVTPIVALSRDSARGFREIPLEAGAQGVVLTVCMARTTRRSADGRRPVDNGTHAFDVAVHQVRASNTRREQTPRRAGPPAEHPLEVEDLTVLTAWAEGAAEALAHASEHAAAVVADARAGADWRPTLGLPEPSEHLIGAIDCLERAVRAASTFTEPLSLKAMVSALRQDPPEESDLEGVVRRVLAAMLEERATRQPEE
jgi:hypothetical protein